MPENISVRRISGLTLTRLRPDSLLCRVGNCFSLSFVLAHFIHQQFAEPFAIQSYPEWSALLDFVSGQVEQGNVVERGTPLGTGNHFQHEVSQDEKLMVFAWRD